MAQLSYRRHRFPASIIQHAIWLYLRFTLSYRNLEDLLAERGLDISYETVRRWVLKFWSCDRAQDAAAPAAAERPMASRRDGGSDRRHMDVSVARRRPPGRDPQEARFRAEVAGY
jgi:hypothetical protein